MRTNRHQDTFGRPLVILPGGDPAHRDDLFDIIEEAVQRGLSASVTLVPHHSGDIYPSDFLPIAAGNVKSDSIVEVTGHTRLQDTPAVPSVARS